MKRQLYYLLPDIGHTQQLCKELIQLDIDENRIHAVTKQKSGIKGIQDVHTINETDRDFFLESYLWRLNLTVFGLAFLVTIGLMIWYPSVWMSIPMAVMALSFLAGMYFAVYMPRVHWQEFLPAIRHGEVLLIVDVPESEVRHIDQVVHRHHPEAVNGGVCWKA